MKRAALGLSACLALSLLTPGFAQDLKVSGTSVGITIPGTANSTLTVAGPQGFYMQNSSRSGSVALRLGAAGRLPDGTYKYEITAATGETTVNRNTLDNGRGVEPPVVYVGITKSGTFAVKGGAIILPNESDDNDSDG